MLLSARDREDIRLAAANQATYVSVPFVRTAADVLEVRRGGGERGMLGRGATSGGCTELCADVLTWPLHTMPQCLMCRHIDGAKLAFCMACC